ncbi:hypothetical protein [Mariniblastus fucicola]|uniref:Uncharacterized protein n=1 Tax=Mariniblastus fucicola TaxID=980251 RepID=A0A5B9PD71_9BACT|nr:hypothetical protein [Mariniblastus fucicola]QEG23040.1 hypothetical protein MFFC18_29320 [Mariniblastus fucicola]
MDTEQLELCSCFDCGCVQKSVQVSNANRSSTRAKKIVAMYVVMVAVSTTAIFFLEHASLLNAFRTALVAAVGKTIAANWVSGLFD